MGRFFRGNIVTGYWLLVTRYSCLPPSVVQSTTPPAQVPPTQTLFARGPGAVGIIRCLIPIVTPWLGHGAQVIKIPRNARTNLYILYTIHIKFEFADANKFIYLDPGVKPQDDASLSSE